MKQIFIFLFVVSFSVVNNAAGQSLPVGSFVLEDQYRRSQLLNEGDTARVSFMIRPLSSASLVYGKDAGSRDRADSLFRGFDPLERADIATGFVGLLPVSFLWQYNSDHPYGWNDGAMIPARGQQVVTSAGIYGQFGPLSFQFKPEYVYAQNRPYEGFPTEHYDVLWARYYDSFLNYADLPEQFGEKSYSRLLPGQSNVRLTFGPVSAGLSTENLWWGPGMRNSLLMSNTSRGFGHITLNTARPLKTGIGSFEAQMIAGRLENSGYLPPEINRIFDITGGGRTLYIPKRNDWRYISGLVFTYQPKWLPGLFLGVSRTYQMYGADMKRSFTDYVPLISSLRKLKTNDGINRDQLASAFFRWIMPEEHAEIYFEYGFNDYGYIPGSYLREQKTSKAYIGGLRKLIPFGRPGEYISAGIELTRLEQQAREADPFYEDGYIRQGYTNRGEVLGAGIGPGSNLQSLDVSWVKGLKKLGVQLERYVHNNDYYYYAYVDIKDPRKHWVDLSASATGEWNYKNLLFNAKFSAIRSLNYEYFLLDHPPLFFVPGRDVFNFQGQLGITYRL